jgi:predicted extracellular nuclease
MTRRRALICSAVFLLALIVTAIGGAVSSPAPTAVSLGSSTYSQFFDSLGSSGSSNALPEGWMLSEAGTSATNDGKYNAGIGSATAGDTYSFGATGSGERALGTLLSGTLTSTIGAKFTNATGGTITSLDVAYTGEEWRFGTTGRADRLDFQYSLDATDLATGTWTDADALDFSTPNVSVATGSVDGNLAADQSAISSTIAGLSIPSGQTFWIRWTDFNASGSDDGLAVDGFSVTPHTTTVTNQPVTANCGANITTAVGTAAAQQLTATDADGTVTSIARDSVSPASSAITVDNVTPATATGGTATATLNVSSSAAAGTYSVQVRASNNDATPQSTTCSLTVTVTAAPVTLTIGAVQGSVSDTADGKAFPSPYVGQTVNVRGVVTELTHEGANNGFYLQNSAATADSDPSSSDGIFVFIGSFPDLKNGYVPVVGDELALTGKVSEFQGMTELGSATATKVGTGSVTPFAADPPSGAADAARYWERHEGMQAGVPTASIVDSPTHLFASTQDTEFYVLAPTTPVAQRSDPYAQRAYREAHPLDDTPGAFNGNGFRILITDEGVKVADHAAKLTQVHTFQRLAAPVAGGVFYAFGKYSVSASAQPQVVEGADPAQNDPPPAFDRSQAYSIANFNMQNLYDYRDDPFDGCDFFGNSGCPGVSPPFDYPPASDAEYQQREGEIAHQIVVDLHSPDVIAAAEAEDQDICTVQSGALVCGTTNNADGQPDVLQELALHIKAIGGPDYATAFDRNGADARGIICAFMYRTDRVQLLPAAAADAVLGSSPTVVYRGAAASYNTDISNPKALNAVLPDDVDRSTGVDGSNVYTRAVQFGHFRIASTTAVGTPSDVWVAANHFTSGPDSSVGQRREQAAYSAAVVKAIQGQEPNAKIMVAGDLNDFPRPDDPFLPTTTPSDQLAPLYDAGLHNLYDTVIAENPAAAYSYVFDGQAQDLDHQFVSDALFADLQGANEAHINADWPGVVGSNRGTSDHDPMVSRWTLKNDNPPTVHAGGPYAVDEGSSVTLTASADDPDGDPVTYAWDLDGNGTFEASGQSAVVSAADGPESRTVTVQATDSFGLTSTDTTTIAVSNVAPTATFQATGSVTAGETATLSFTNPADPSSADVAAGFTYAFDCGSGYGTFSPVSSVDCAAPARGTLSVGGRIQDKDGGIREYRSTVTVNGRSPVVDAGGPYAVDEGGSVALDATGSDPDGDSIAYAWDLDGNGAFETSGQHVTFHAGNGPATQTVAVKATDSTGATATSSATVTVRNVAPTAVFHAPPSATVGVPFTLSLSGPQDPSTGDVAAGFTYAFDCGDGTGYGPFGTAASATCRTLAVGTLTVHGAIKDTDGGTTEYTATVKVGVTFDAVCAIAQQFASPKVAKKICDALARAEKEAAKGHRKPELEALVDAAKEVVKAGERGDLSLAEAATLLRLIAKL